MNYSYWVIAAIVMLLASTVMFFVFSPEAAIFGALIALFTLKLSDRE